ncbi:MAG: dTMP kinase [Verrucomicrobia bacterium]|nr:dTMP kinase [Verrucomicrobiota bacterium]
MKRGRFITFEGPEGSGKSTHIASLAARLAECGIRIVRTREPGGTKLGESLRNILQHDAAGKVVSAEAEALLFAASRAHLVRSVILPALDSGRWVLCDRFADSTTAYQSFGRGLRREAVDAVNAMAVGSAVPDLTILLDLDVKDGFERVAARKGRPDRFERERMGFHRKVRKGYLSLARQFPGRIVRLDASGAIEAVDGAIWAVVSDRFFPGSPGGSKRK